MTLTLTLTMTILWTKIFDRRGAFPSLPTLRLVQNKASQLFAELLLVGEVELVLAYKQLVGDALQRIFHEDLVFVCPKHDAYRVGVARGADLVLKVVEVKVHLPNILV